MKINHINYPDNEQSIYCKKKNLIVKLDNNQHFINSCFNCKYFNGTYQGSGIECLYEDSSDNYVKYYDNAKFAYSEQNTK